MVFQIIDTSFGIGGFYKVQFLNKNIGWGFGIKPNSSTYSNTHTTNGGDTTFLTGIMQISSDVPKKFKLYQNYPNPFNSVTIINYELKIKSNVKIIVYDITGKEVITLVSQQQRAGTYQVDFSSNGLSSGLYFYSLIVDGNLIDTKKSILLK